MEEVDEKFIDKHIEEAGALFPTEEEDENYGEDEDIFIDEDIEFERWRDEAMDFVDEQLTELSDLVTTKQNNYFYKKDKKFWESVKHCAEFELEKIEKTNPWVDKDIQTIKN